MQVVCGCFSGDLDEFEKRIKEYHGDNEYAKQYFREIKIVKYLLRQEGK